MDLIYHSFSFQSFTLFSLSLVALLSINLVVMQTMKLFDPIIQIEKGFHFINRIPFPILLFISTIYPFSNPDGKME